MKIKSAIKRFSDLAIKFLHLIATCLIATCCLYCGNKVITDVKKWKYVETEHFKIYHYHDCEDLLPSISNILEETFNNTIRFCEYRPSKKNLFFIYRNHNEFEQTNIVDIGEGTGGVTEAFKNRFIVYNNGSVGWLRDVIPHEFMHVVQFNILYEESVVLKAMRLAHGIFIPLWMMEGMAEYNTGERDATNREMVIRDMISNKKVIPLKNLNDFSHLKPHQITSAYKLSEMAYHFLVDEYGIDKPQKILKSLRNKLETTDAFVDTLNMTPKLFMKKWEEWLYEKYEDKIIGYREAVNYGTKLTFDNNDNIPDFNTNPTISPDCKSLVFITDNDGVNKLVMIKLSDIEKSKKNKISVIAESNTNKIDVIHNEKVSFSPDGNLLVFSGEKMQKDYIYIYDIISKKLSKLPLNIFTVKSPSFSPDGKKIIFVGMEKAYNDIYEYSFENNSIVKITNDSENQDSPVYSPNGNFITFSQENMSTGHNDIFMLDLATGNKVRLTYFAGDENEPIFSTDGKKIFFVSDENPGSPVNIYTLDIDSKEIKKCTNLLTGASNLSTTLDGKNIIFVYYRDFRKDIYLADISLLENDLPENKHEKLPIETSETPTENKYTQQKVFAYHFKPSLDILIPFVMYHSEYGFFVATYWQASELLGDHQIYNQLLYSSQNGELQYAVGYSYLKWRPQFVFSSIGENSETLTESEELYKEKEHTQSIGITYPLDRLSRFETSVSTKKYTKENYTLNEILNNSRTNRYSVAYNRDTLTGKYLYVRFGSKLHLLFRHAFLECDGDTEYKEYIMRYEKYFPVCSESAIVFGNIFLSGEGRNERFFRLPIRGFSHSDDSYIYNRLIATTVEYRTPVLTLENAWPTSDFFLKSVNAFFFTDSGFGFNTTPECKNMSLGDIKASVGSGIRLYTFLTGYLLPITVDYAKRTNDSGGRWNFSFGVSLAY